MKKYNLSKIMKRAWELVKKLGLSISEGLKKAWKEAKNIKEKFNKVAKIQKTGMLYNSECDFLTFKLWEKYGKKRIYINDYKGRTIGFLEGDSHEVYDTMGNELSVIENAISDFREKYEFQEEEHERMGF